jgi:tetratricopeptide (TPR) repeat protein
MLDDSRVQQLIEEILDSEKTPEEVCRDTPELLPEVREGWRRLRAIQSQLGALFPEPGYDVDHEPTAPEIGLPTVPGYEIGEVLGRGGVGVVYKAMHLRLNRTVALKMLLAGGFATRAERQRFAREAEVVARLRHPNIVQVYDVGDLGGRPYFTMEFAEGGSLAEMIAGTPRPARQAAELVAAIADAMHAAHLGGIVHRDLKPSNVLLAADGTPKIGDFGLARQVEVGSSLTQSGAAVGTPSYMAPEQAEGKTREIGPASDLYALGAVLYELLTGRPPFRAESAAETLHQVITRDPVPPSRLNAKVPRDLETICLKCLRKEPPLRYADASALAEDLRRFLRGESIAARPENWLQRLARRVRRRPAFSASVAASSILGATMVVVGLWLINERAETARSVKAEKTERERKANAEQEALEQAVQADLREMADLQRRSAWPEAIASLERAKGRIGESGSAELRGLLDQRAREMGLVARLDAIRLGRYSSNGGDFDLRRADSEFEAAFVKVGIGRVKDDARAVAARVNASNIRKALVDALDEWSEIAAEPSRRDWLVTVAREADHDPTGWRDRARDPSNWKSEEALARLLQTAPVADDYVRLLWMIGDHWRLLGRDSIPFFKRVQQAHPGDFDLNMRLGFLLWSYHKPEEAVGLFQAALAIRPGLAVVHNNLGLALASAGRQVEAVDQYRMATTIDPTAIQAHYGLIEALKNLRRFDDAFEACQIAFQKFPKSGVPHFNLGLCLNAQGRNEEALAEFQRAFALDPKLYVAGVNVRLILMSLGRTEEAKSAWEAAIAGDPPDHEFWYGYAEFCLFLGHEEDYLRARRALIAKFGDSTDPYVAERTARACLLLPLSGDELRRVVALGERAWSVDRSRFESIYPHFLFVQALAEYRQGRLDRAALLLQGEASRVLGPAPRLILAMALHRDGQGAAARKMLAAAVLAYDWRPTSILSQDNCIYHALRREAEAMIVPKLPEFLEGTYQPIDNDERLALLGVCQFMNRKVAAARLYAEAFANDPRLADDLSAGHRYNAARVAILAGLGRGGDAAGLDDSERRRWREQARQWLRADLAALRKVLADRAIQPATIRHLMIRWQDEPDLAGLRDPAELDKLPDDERKDCLTLWEEVRVLDERAGQAR